MTTLRSSFEFLDEGAVEYSDGVQSPRKMELATSGLAYDSMIALSVYVINTPEKFCSPALIRLLGRHLFEFLLPDERIRGEVEGRCTSSRVVLDLSFRYEANRYAQLPWEFLTLPVGRSWRFLNNFGDVTITLTRHVPMQRSLSTLDREVKVLLDVSSPRTLAKIAYRDLEQKLNELEDRYAGRLKVRVERNRTLEEIRNDLQTWQPDVFHWSGHGDRDALWLAQAERSTVEENLQKLEGSGRPLGFAPLAEPEPFKAPIDAITALFSKYSPRLVVLDACGSDWSWLSEMLPGVAHQLVQYVPAVIAMRYPISNAASSTFAEHLYEGIVTGLPLDQAVQAARNALASPDVGRAYGTPVLYLDNSMPLCGPLVTREPEPVEAIAPRLEAHQPFPCVFCSAPVNPGRAFCPRCRARYRCAQCDAAFEPNEVVDLNFCPACGFRYGEEVSTQPGPRADAATTTARPPRLAAAHDSQLVDTRAGPAGLLPFRGFRDSEDADDIEDPEDPEDPETAGAGP